ncbi:MAG: TonB-dependent receptor [Deltaproteobacteria bacterium]|nr:TonB-dependent receptor [Deltaproteobacteria bacterium]MCW5808824.1 TonB-dependent receptor [Deltaproteobacteria bacterium]
MPRTLAVLACLTSVAHADGPGSIKGTVIFEGEAPDRKPLTGGKDEFCQKQGQHLDDDVVVTRAKVKDVLVRIKNGTAGAHKVPAAPVVIDQKQCMYTPRVVGMIAGQKLLVRNSDGTFHNVHAKVAGATLWNKPMPEASPDLSLDGAPKAGDVAALSCGAHPWMSAFAVVQDHPYFAVTPEDGTFEIRGLAPGTYTLEAWHPSLGMKSMTVKIGTGPLAAITARFSYKPGDK